MRCHYEVLEVNKTADDDEIKKAYRKLALVWHPDKNFERLAEAEGRFKEIQNAYEILSDPNERRWYDTHREQILKADENFQQGASGTTNFQSNKPEYYESLYKYFSKSCFSDFSDRPKGFYKIYSAVFDKIANEENRMANENFELQEQLPSRFPSFGYSNSDLQNVKEFYSFYVNFSTILDFTWADQYNPNTAPDRRVRRAMEKENLKSRSQEKKSYLDTVRELAEFVKKRDPRVIKLREEEQQKREQKVKLELEKQKQLKQERMRQAMQYEEPEWVKQSDLRYQEKEKEDETSEEEYLQSYYCVVCNKTFKSERALINHEKSKKHKQMQELLKDQLEQDETDQTQDETQQDNNELADNDRDSLSTAEDVSNSKSQQKSKDNKEFKLEREFQSQKDQQTNQQNKNQQYKNQQQDLDELKSKSSISDKTSLQEEDSQQDIQDLNNLRQNDFDLLLDSDNEIEDDLNQNTNMFEQLDQDENQPQGDKKQKKKQGNKQNQNQNAYNSQIQEQQNVAQQLHIDIQDLNIQDRHQNDQWLNDTQKPKKNKKGKKSINKQQDSNLEQDISKQSSFQKQDPQQQLKCQICNQSFQSKNKLFEHIKNKRHIALK